MNTPTLNGVAQPAWATGLGAIAVLLGILLTAWYCNEVTKMYVVGNPPFSIDSMPEPACDDEDELIEEGLSLMECQQMALSVHDISLSSPDWFRKFYIAVSGLGAVIAIISTVIGIALVDFRSWAPTAAIVIFSMLMAVDAMAFVGVVNTGPLIRQTYLWNFLLWFLIHLLMTVGAFTGRQSIRSALTYEGM